MRIPMALIIHRLMNKVRLNQVSSLGVNKPYNLMVANKMSLKFLFTINYL